MMLQQQLLRRRLYQQCISRSACTSPAEAVSWMGAMQAQDYAGTKWSIALRVPGTTDSDIETALDNASVVRTWSLRGTLHVMAAADVRWILAAAAPRALEKATALYQKEGYDDKLFKRGMSLLEKTLCDHRYRTRDELKTIVEERLGLRNKENYLLGYAALNGLICLGPRRGKEFTYALLDEWVKPSKAMTANDGKAMLAERFFTSHGPATLNDFAWWSGFTVTEAKALLQEVGPRLQGEVSAGATYWLGADSVALRKSTRVHLLPGFDEYMFGYSDRSLIVSDRDYKRISGTGNGIFASTLIVDGRVVGRWKRTVSKNEVLVTLEPFVALSSTEKKAALAAAERYSAYLALGLTTKGF